MQQKYNCRADVPEGRNSAHKDKCPCAMNGHKKIPEN